ncbi:LOW QUALITY PROTEIN: probable E3 ubiquitin-protein ligase DTX3 [Melopsittacus undulatus]|uniref:LOW QUALITY PROTEIN: probable E3 ubiquitin-protein ligase DTX3 n=1 Tax=Melopsittacus undulatus TaxID=13146 RepID=UPI00146ECC2D|nr:LOW QUALITY PROTEIN: probable E3 ubiquitin-protein ligase DTX3 [Melopsittacus undulatus]
MGSPVSFVLSRMSTCAGTTKNRLTVPKRVWDFLTREHSIRLLRLTEETGVNLVVDAETPDAYVLQLLLPPHTPPGRLYPVRKALKVLVKDTEKELKKRRQSDALVCVTVTKPHSGTGIEPHSAPPPSPIALPLSPIAPPPNPIALPPNPIASPPPSPTPPPPTPTPYGAPAEDPERQCPICLGEIREPRTLERCRHSFCSGCIARALEVRTACPVCGRFYGVLVGNQPPDGRMMVTRDGMRPLPGYEGCGTIVIQYVFPPGVQGEEHPNPGVRYPGTTRVAYLPDCPEGNKVLGLFRKAFAQRLTFTVGTSMTTGRANVITWNDIHHKTSCTGGPQLFGYPDPTYLTRVQEELRAKGITED